MLIICKLTGTKGKGVKSHIIPESFYEIPPQTEGCLKLASNISGGFIKKIPVGIYDSGIVTQKGEDIFNTWDNYAAKTLLNRSGELEPLIRKQEIIGWNLNRVNSSLLKLFALSMLWRAHASSQVMFTNVDLGIHEPIIRSMLLKSDPGKEDDYSVFIVKWTNDERGPVYMDPLYERYEGVNFYRFYGGRFIFYIKIDQRKTPLKLNPFQLADGPDLTLAARDLEKSKELSLIIKIVRKNLSQ